MATDVARLSFDPARFYRGVVPQQGRVSLEAEQNEQRVIDADERRKELLDIVGPAGTPDNGYAISGSADFTIGAGTMYVGGLRVELDEDIAYSEQPDWLDHPNFDVGEQTREHIVLELQDTDVTAVEDPALYEVALGGPDGAARTRLLQHVARLRTDADTCAEALAEDVKLWTEQGLTFDPATMRLESDSRLLVTWEGDPEPANPCEPSSTGGYLGAENQLIRVQLTQVGRDGTFDLVWGYDDASFLYRVTPDASVNPVLTLDRTPVDDYHRPRAGQAVQALRATADLQSTDGVVEGYVAALGGEVAVLTAPYDPDTKTVQFPAALPGDYLDPKQNPQLFLRIWEEQLTGLELGKPVSLTGTGMQVTITATGGVLHVDDFWCIGLRPSTPTTVYPDRYLRTPQPPDGPHLWVCPLAVIVWEKEQLVVLEDCRHHFNPLTEIGGDGCCTVEVRPTDAAGLQELIDRAAAGRVVSDRNSRVTVCFAPGRYELPAPLVLRKQHSNMTLRGCGEAAVIAANPDDIAEFGQGLFVMLDVDNVTISGLELVLPQVPGTLGNLRSSTGGVFNRSFVRAVNAAAANRYVSIGIRAIECAVLEISECLFRYSLGEHETTPEIEQTMPRTVFAVGIFLSGGSWGLAVRHNRFLHHAQAPAEDRETPQMMSGLIQVQAMVGQGTGRTTSREIGAVRLPAVLADAEISHNVFDGITGAVTVDAHLGSVRVLDNVIRNGAAGVALLDETAMSNVDLAGEYKLAQSAESVADGVAQMRSVYVAAMRDPVLAQLLLLAATYPLPSVDDWTPTGLDHLDLDHIDALRSDAAELLRTAMSRTVERIVAEQSPADAPAPEVVTSRRRAAVDFNKLETAQSTLSPGMAEAMVSLAELSRVGTKNIALDAAIEVDRNVIDCTVPIGSLFGMALWIMLRAHEEGATTAIVADNRLSSINVATALVSGANAVTVTGNIVVGARSENSIALGVGNTQAAAITGNVVAGRAVLPVNRPFPPPLDTWLPLNTIG